MNEEIENVTEEVTENTDAQAVEEIEEGIELTDTAEATETEETPVEEEKEEEPKGRFMTDDEIDKLVMKKVNRRVGKIEEKYEKELAKYKDTDNILRSTLSISEDEDVNQKLRATYEADGVKLPSRYEPGLSSREIERLAKGDAEDFIEDGYDSAAAEANRLANKRYENLNERERITFNTLVDYLNTENDKRELLSLGAKEELLSDKSFNDFRKKFNSNVPIKDIYSLYNQSKPKKEIENPGSMKNVATNNDVKEFYTPEEANKFTRADFDKNPKLLEAIENSMTLWGKKYR